MVTASRIGGAQAAWLHASATFRRMWMRAMLGVGAAAVLSWPPLLEAARPFTVADSVEMTRVNTGRYWLDDPAEPDAFHPSPDGKYTLVVLRRGNLATGMNEYRLVSFATKSVREYVNSSDQKASDERRPIPEFLATFSTAAWTYGIDRVQWHPDGRTVFFIGRGPDEIGQVFGFDLDRKELQQLTRHAQNVEDFALSSDRRTLLYAARSAPEDWTERNARGYTLTMDFIHDLTLKDPGEAARRYIDYFVLDRRHGRVTRIDIPRSFSSAGVWLSPSGRRAVILVPVRGIPEGWDAYELVERMRTDQERPLEPAVAALAQVEADGVIVDDAFAAFASSVVNQFYVIDTVSGHARPLLNAPAVIVGFGKAIWSQDDAHVVLGPTFLPLDVTDPEERQRRRSIPAIVELDIAAGTARRVIELANMRGSPANPAYRRRLPSRFDRLADGSVQIEYREFRTGSADAAREVQRFRLVADRWIEAPVMERAAIARASRLEYSLYEDMNTPPEIAALDQETDRKLVITDLNPKFRELSFGKVQVFEWRDRLGRNHTGGLLLPPDYRNDTRYPIVIQTYGFSPARFLVDGPPLASKAAFAAQALANRGMLVLQMPTSSAAADMDGPYTNIGENPRFIAMLESAVDALADRELIDRSRVGLVGFSRSGMHVLNAITFSAYPIAAATSADSITDTVLSYVALYGHPDWGGMTDWEGPQRMGAPFWGHGISLWLERSTAFHLDRIRTPLRLEMYGTGVDPRWDTYAILKRFRRPVEFVRIPNARHVVTQPWAAYTSQQGNVDWFAFWLRGEEDPDPAKVEQYVRWRKLRAQHEAHLKDLGAEPSAREAAPTSHPRHP